jgi:RND superfamily putative drug exporter
VEIADSIRPVGVSGSGALFFGVGRFAIRYRWIVVVWWLLVTAAAVNFLPSMGNVIKNDNTAFLPANSPSVRAANLAAAFLSGDQQVGTIVAVGSHGLLTPADEKAIDRIEASARRAPDVVTVRDASVSPGGEARTAIVEFSPSTEGGGRSGAASVAAIRADFATAPPGLSFHLTGPLPELVDQQRVGARTANHVELLSALLILALLALAFRSALAPLAALAPAGLSLALAGPLIAESTKLGVQISSLLQLLLTALVLGAGTDYGLFLLFRYRENLRRGLAPNAAIEAAVGRVGESITFSAATVIAALLSLLLASFGLYRGVGPGLAIGIAVVLLVELTFFPALLSILGRAVFWPSVVAAGPERPGRWGAISARVSGRPVAALMAGTVAMAALAVSLVHYAPSGFDPGGFIAGSDSGAGEAALVQYFGASAVSATDVVIRLPMPVWSTLTRIETITEGLRRSSQFTSVAGALQADGSVAIAPQFLERAYQVLGPPGTLPVVEPSHFRVDPYVYDAYRSTAQFISPDGRTLLYRVSLRAGSPGTTAALQAIPGIRRTVADVARSVRATEWGVAGQAASAADVSQISGTDILKVAPVVLAVLTLLLALVLRSLVAPVYLVASVALSYVASLGLAVLIFVVIDNQLGVNFTLPFFLFVFIMALGEDYNILVMSRIREEAAQLPLRRAVAAALGTTGTTVTSAGLVLAGTFGVLAVTTSGQIRQIGTGLALGILLDTFVVRTLLVPSAAVLTGRWNWWPSRLYGLTVSDSDSADAAEPVP